MKEHMYLLIISLLLLLSPSCATIMQGTVQEIPVSSSPSGATIIVDGGLRFKTPTTLVLSRKDVHKIEITMEGHEPKIVELTPSTSGAVAGNILFGGLIGLAVDSSSGASSVLAPATVHVELVPTTPQPLTVSSPVSQGTAEESLKPDKTITQSLEDLPSNTLPNP